MSSSWRIIDLGRGVWVWWAVRVWWRCEVVFRKSLLTHQIHAPSSRHSSLLHALALAAHYYTHSSKRNNTQHTAG